MLLKNKMLICFEGYAIDRLQWSVRWRQEPIAVKRKSMDVLLYLIDQRDRVVSKEELLQTLWTGQFVEEGNLTQHIFLLRKALSRHESGKTLIATIAGRGYRFVAELEEQTPSFNEGVINAGGSAAEITSADHELEADTFKPGPPLDTDEIMPPLTAPTTPSGKDSLPVARWVGGYRSPDRNLAWSPVRWLVSVAALLVGTAVYFAMQAGNQAHWGISAYKQITTDGRPKTIGGTDGSRIYFTQVGTRMTEQVSITGGMVAPIQLGIDNAWSGDVSSDGSTMLVNSQAGGQGPANSLWSFQLVGGSIRHLADSAVSSAWSPGGERIVYASTNGDIFVMRRDGSQVHRIASVDGYIRSMAWSPDGDAISFSKDGLLWETSPDGSNLRQMFPGWSKSPTQVNGEWMPDGRFLFVADGQIWMIQDRRGLFSNLRGSPTQLTFGPTVWDRPVASPDGKNIFASGRTKRGELVRLDTRSGNFRPFLAGISAEFVVFSSDGKSVAYVSYPEGILWRANRDGSNPVQLTEPPFYPKVVRWSPDDSQLVFVNQTAEAVDAIFLIASDGSGRPHRILPEDRHAETDPSWSPDGKKIAFATSPNVGASAKSDLRILDCATKKVTSIPDSEGLLVPRWSPDARFISAMTLDSASLRLFNLSTGTWAKLDTGPVAFPEWSHDGQWIDYVRWTADPSVLRIRAADGRRENVADLKGARYTGSYTLWMGLDPTDAPMMLRDEGTDNIYALTLDRK